MSKRMVLLLLICVMFVTRSDGQQKAFHVVFISACNEYFSHISLKAYGAQLAKKYPNVTLTLLQAEGPLNKKQEYSNLRGTEVLKDCDVLLVFARRTTISGKAMDDIRNYVNAGKPLVALRTSSHGFESWPEFDREVLGGNYSNHLAGSPEDQLMGSDSLFHPVGKPTGPGQTLIPDSTNRKHPVLKGIKAFHSKYSLYKTAPISTDAQLLLTGKTPEGMAPAAWTRLHRGGRVVYISLGGLQDWQNRQFTRLVTNALFWAGNYPAKMK